MADKKEKIKSETKAKEPEQDATTKEWLERIKAKG